MTNDQALVIEPLASTHNRPSFSCGNDSLDNYLRAQARQDIKRRVSRAFVAIDAEQPDKILGYYTLSSLAIDLSQLPLALARKLPKHRIPAALIGRLAVDERAQGFGVGRMLLMDALNRTLTVSQEIAIFAMVVDAIDKQAEAFYRQFGFSALGTEGRRLFLPLKSI